jgi:uncharacterized protein (DUF4415 family)
MKEQNIVRRSLSDRRPGKTDWPRVRAMTEEEIDRNAENDPDNPPWTDEELAAAQLVLPSTEPRVPVSIRLHPEVVRFFKKQGAGYQSRINAVLLAYVRSQKKNTKKKAG